MNSSDPSIQPSPAEDHLPESELPAEGDSMEEFYQLRQELLLTTLILAAIALGPVWWFYNLNVALNYFIGAMAGVIYLGLLARNVERLGTQKQSVGKSQLAIFVGVIIVASQVEKLSVMPVFLGFLTYKAAILVYTLKTVVSPR